VLDNKVKYLPNTGENLILRPENMGKKVLVRGVFLISIP